jgi:hypothetical protein
MAISGLVVTSIVKYLKVDDLIAFTVDIMPLEGRAIVLKTKSFHQ